ncbi:hypothetical protein H9P43_001787 [Blastocladiella emersonii ATCC 22665]|nr:hypothetical protein H9P43_001787 [Blastocladiella emersonii ATCC 22665]
MNNSNSDSQRGSLSDEPLAADYEAGEGDENNDSGRQQGRLGNRKRGKNAQQQEEEENVIFEYRVIVLGDAGTGKSDFVGTASGQPYSTHNGPVKPDIVVFKSANFPVHGYSVRVEFWDPPGHASTMALTARLSADLNAWIAAFHLLNTDGQFRRPVIVVANKADLADEFNGTPQPVSNASSAATSMVNITAGLVNVLTPSSAAAAGTGGGGANMGLPLDKARSGSRTVQTKRAVSSDDAQAWAQDHGAEYFEVSSLTGRGVREAMAALVKTVSRQLPQGVMSDIKSLIDLRIRPARTLPHGKNVEYKNRMALLRRIPDLTDTVDWLVGPDGEGEGEGGRRAADALSSTGNLSV